MAQAQLDLFLIIFWMAVIVFVVVVGALVYAVIRYRRKPGEEIPRQVHGNLRLEIAWTIAPALVLVVIAVPTIITIFDTANTPTGEPTVQVNVTAHQWWWEFEYFTEEELDKEKADLEKVKRGELDRTERYKPKPYLVTANELHVPVGQVIDVKLESDDVIHSFWIPKLAGKIDVVPNNTNSLWFKADEPGTYRGLCAEFCGTAHAQMRFLVIAEPEETFNGWVADQQTVPDDPIALVMGLKACGVCHTINGPDGEGVQQMRMDAFLRGEPKYPAPNLTHFASRSTFAAGLLERTDENLRRWLIDPNDVKPGNHMGKLAAVYTESNMALEEDDVSGLVAYLQSLK